MIEIKVEKDEITNGLKALQGKLNDLTPVMRSIAAVMLSAVEDNFLLCWILGRGSKPAQRCRYQ